MNRLILLFWNRVENSTKLDDSTYQPYKKILLGTVLFFFMSSSTHYGELPHLLFDPPRLSFMTFWSSFPSYKFILLLELFLITLMVLLWFDIKPVLCGVLIAIIMIVHHGIGYTLGKVDHAIMLPVTFLIMSMTHWKGKRLFSITPESILAVVLCFGMFTAGIQKMVHWVDFDLNTSGFLSWFVNGYYNYGRSHLLADFVLGRPLLMYELADYAAVMLELSPVFFLVSGKKWLWQFWILIVCLFHIANMLFLNISFEYHTVIYLLFFMSALKTKWLENRFADIAILIVAGLQVLSIIFYNHTIIDSLFSGDSSRLLFFLIVWIGIIFIGVKSLKKNFRNS